MITRVAQNAFNYFKNSFFQDKIGNLSKFNETEFEELSEKIIDNAIVVVKDVVSDVQESEKKTNKNKDSSLWAAYNPETPLDYESEELNEEQEPPVA